MQCIDFKPFDSTNYYNLCFSEPGQAVGSSFFGLFTMPITFILSTSPI